MKKSFIPIKFICKCGCTTREFVWSDNKKAKCGNCGEELNETNIPKVEQTTAIRTPTKNR